VSKVEALVKKLDSLSDWTGKIFAWVIVPLTLLVVYEVITRRFLNAPTIWSFEVITQLFGFHFMILAAYGLLYKAHVSVDFLSSRWSERTRAIVEMAGYLIFFFPFLTIALWHGTLFALKSWSIGETSSSYFHPPLYYIKTVIPIAIFLLILQGVSEFIKKIIFTAKGIKI